MHGLQTVREEKRQSVTAIYEFITYMSIGESRPTNDRSEKIIPYISLNSCKEEAFELDTLLQTTF